MGSVGVVASTKVRRIHAVALQLVGPAHAADWRRADSGCRTPRFGSPGI